jgi:flagellar biosynthesis protein FlhG
MNSTALEYQTDLALERESPATPFLLFTGGKGGVGKTTLTADLGVLLARQGRRVLLVDLDLGLANLDVVLRLRSDRTVEDALAGRCSFEDCVVRGPHGVYLLPAGSGSAEMGMPDQERRRRLLAGLARLAPDYDVLLGDSAAGIGHDVLAFAAAADHVFVVTTPTPAALTDAYGLIKAIDTWGRESGSEVPTPELVVNQVSGLEQAEATAARLRGVCEHFLCRRPRTAGWLPDSADALVAGSPTSALGGLKSLYYNCLSRLAVRVSRLLGSPATGTGT